jgi:capsular exopolysaccharide synthesis family protein
MSSNSLISVPSRERDDAVLVEPWRQAGVNAAAGEPEALGADLNQMLNVLFRRRWLIVGTVVASVAVAAIGVFRVTPRFTAEARILIETRQDRITAIESVIPGLSADEATLNSQAEVLKSRGLARTVVERMNLANDPELNPALRPDGTLERLMSAARGGIAGGAQKEDAAPANDVPVVEEVLRRLDVQAITGSRIIALHFTSESPTRAAEIANSFLNEYLSNQREAKLEATKRANAWLDATVSGLGEQVAASEEAVEAFRRESGLFQNEGVTLTSQEVSGLNAELIRARAVAAQAEARLEQFQSLAGSPDSLTSVGEVLDSPLIQNLREQEATVERRLAEMSSELGPLHPKMTQLQADARDLETKIAQEIDKIVQRLENDARVASAHAQALSEQLERLKTQVAENNENGIRLRALEREAEANRNLLATLLARYREVGSQSDREVQQPDATIVSSADVPNAPSYPNKKVVLGLAAIGSLLLGCALACLLELRDRTFRSGDEIERVLGTPSLGLVPIAPELRKARRKGEADATFYRSRSAFAESMQELNWTLTHANAGHSPATVLVTSAEPGEGKTTVALGLASCQALAGRKVLLIDADTGKGDLPGARGMPEMAGLLNVLDGAEPSEVIVHDQASGLDVMTAGRSSGASLPLLESAVLDALLRKLGATYDLIVLDSPPIAAVADACVLAPKVQSTVFVARWGVTRREVVEHALRQLRRSGAPVAGVLLCMVDVAKHAAYLYGDSGRYRQRFAYYRGA